MEQVYRTEDANQNILDSLPLPGPTKMDDEVQVAMISMRMKKFYKKARRKLQFDAKKLLGYNRKEKSIEYWKQGNGNRTDRKEGFYALVQLMEKVGWDTHSKIRMIMAFKSCNKLRFDTEKVNLRSGLMLLSLRSMNQLGEDRFPIPTKQQETPSFANQQVKTPRETVKNQYTHSQKPKVDKKDLGKAELNNGWNNVQRVNKQNQFVPSAVLTRTGIIPVNTARTSSTKIFSTARQSVNRQTILTSTAMKVNTVKPIMNRVRPVNVFYKTHSSSSRPFKRPTVLRTDFSKQKVNTAKDYPHRALKNKGIVDSGCSRHMTGNKAYLAEFQDFNGGPVIFEIPNKKLLIRPYGCHVDTSVNTIDHLGKFAGKSDEGFLVGYSLQSKAFRVYNLETKRVEENLHITFLENKPNVAGKGPTWLYDLGLINMISMTNHPVSSENQANLHAGQQEANQNAVNGLLILHIHCPSLTPEDKREVQERKNNDKKGAAKTSSTNIFSTVSTPAKASSTNPLNTASIPVSTASPYEGLSLADPTHSEEDDLEIPPLEDIYQTF
ncbi:hypothetical protein Tco_1563160 [Tanacetum coccineum]